MIHKVVKLFKFGRMKLFTLDMEITGTAGDTYLHRVLCDTKSGSFAYNPKNQRLDIPDEGEVNLMLSRNQSQLLKILRTKNRQSFYVGFGLRFVLTENKNVTLFNDMDTTIMLDRKGMEDEISVESSGKTEIHQLFTDASFLEKTGSSGIAAIIQYPDKSYRLHSIASNALGNCEAELEAVAAGLEILREVKEIRIISDSRYVRKGLTEWMFNWRLNNWKTSNGNSAKNIEIWKKIDRLTQNKYIEVAWVKGHSGHFENTMCDLYAREAAEKS